MSSKSNLKVNPLLAYAGMGGSCRGIPPTHLQSGMGRRWVVTSMLQPLYPQHRMLALPQGESRWHRKSHPTEIHSPAHSTSLYWLHHPGHHSCLNVCICVWTSETVSDTVEVRKVWWVIQGWWPKLTYCTISQKNLKYYNGCVWLGEYPKFTCL